MATRSDYVPTAPDATLPPGAKRVSTPGSRARAWLDVSERKALLVAGDLLCLSLALVGALSIHGELARRDGVSPVWLVSLGAVWLLVAPLAGCYDLKTAADRRATLAAVFRAGVVALGFYLFLPYISAPLLSSRALAAGFFVAALLLLASWRHTYATFVRQPRFQSRTLVVGAGWAGRTLVETIQAYAPHRYEVIGFVDDDPAKLYAVVDDYPVVGDSQSLGELVREFRVQEIILAITHNLREDLPRSLFDAFQLGVRVTPMTDLYESLTSRIPVQHVGERWFVVLPQRAEGSLLHSVFKRALDVAFGLLGCLALGVALPFVALALRLDSPGPIFYHQERCGLGGKPFRIAKFRSMVQYAERPGQAVWAQAGDARVTRVGRVLRKTRLDELPQFLCILRGEMSLIGPRPERPSFVTTLQEEIPFYRARLLVKPGLTGWAQVMYRYGSSVEDALMKLQYDLYYVKHQSIFLDILIVLKTVGIVLGCKGT
ncbi:MAG: sugar transferase [Chloroflexota bacterium]